MDMQKDVAKLGEKIEGMRDDLRELRQDAKDTREKVVEVEKSISIFKGAKLALGAMGAVLLVILGAFLGHVFDSKNGAAAAAPVVDPSPKAAKS